MTFIKTTSIFFMTAALLGAGVTAASAETPFQQAHPRRAEVVGRADHQIHRVNVERREGEISANKARQLRAEDRHVIRQQRRMAMRQDGHITRAQQAHLNHEENRIGQRIPG